MSSRLLVPADGSLSTFHALHRLPDIAFHHFAYELRHPIGIYRKSISEIDGQFQAVFSGLDDIATEFYETGAISRFDALLRDYKRLLFALREHIDNCYLILQSLTPVDEALLSKKPFSNQYLKAAKYPGFNKFENAICPYKTQHIGAIVNALKHKQRTLRGIGIHSKSDSRFFVPGYYVEGTSASGALAPCRSVHDSEHSAFSFNRDIVLHIWNLFVIDQALSHAIDAGADLWNASNHQATGISPSDNPTLRHLLKRAEAFPAQHFPDEIRKPSVTIKPRKDGWTLQYPSRQKAEPLPDEFGIRVFTKADLTTPYINLPYFKNP